MQNKKMKSILALLVLGLCQTVFAEPVFSKNVLLSKDIFRKVPFSSQYSEDGSLIRSIDFRSVNDLIPQLEEQFKVELKGNKLEDRNESHITIITPPEGKTDFFPGSIGIDKVLPTAEMINMYKGNIQNTSFEIECVGMQKNATNTVFYLVVKEAEDILDIREEIYEIVQDEDPTIPFYPTNDYYPHITIGFVGGDVFVDENGNKVSKGKDTCVAGINYK